MHIIRGIKNVPPQLRGAAVVIGNFDGVHRGHQALMHTLHQWATELGNLPTLVITFEPHPQKVLNHASAPERITGLRGKARWIEQGGVDGLLVLRFSHPLAALTPEQFVRQILVEALAVRAVLVGENFRFGAGGKGDCTTLCASGTALGFEVSCQSLLLDDNQVVSSTRIRELVKQGQLAAVEPLLGRPFEIEGRISHGEQRGRALGFPTANLCLADFLYPPPGVYIVESQIQGEWLPAVANLGRNPTFGSQQLHLEVHLLAACGDLYHQVMRVRFLQRLRDEKRFADGAALKRQIGLDVQQAEKFFDQRRGERTASLSTVTTATVSGADTHGL
ncbi:MAG: bifunctional riboflavin kinase/FAD synthetase [Magnetococcales bacterium]|nr:bifunctional riboflavin kinase/FAD synthetase [Magnetococcales bacterium]